MITSHCRICAGPKTLDTFHLNECAACTDLKEKASKAIREANPTISDSDLLYGVRMALNERAHHAHRNFVDPRQHASLRGMLPIPPQRDLS